MPSIWSREKASEIVTVFGFGVPVRVVVVAGVLFVLVSGGATAEAAAGAVVRCAAGCFD